jgi:hypothetical protein
VLLKKLQRAPSENPCRHPKWSDGCPEGTRGLGAETVESAALPLEGVDDVEGGDGLALGVLRVCNAVTNDI